MSGLQRRAFALARHAQREEIAASAAEYAVMLGVVTVALVLVLSQFKDAIGNSFTRSGGALASANSEAALPGGSPAAGPAAGPDNGNGNGNGNGNDDGDGQGQGRGRGQGQGQGLGQERGRGPQNPRP